MPARFIKLGEPAHDNERQAIRFLVESLPATYTVYGNAWLVERSGVVHELDAVVVAPHAVFVVEIKGYRGTIEGTDYDWYIPEPIKSPLGTNHKTAQILHSLMKKVSHDTGQLWVQGLVFLSATTRCNVRGAQSQHRIHTRASIIAALTDAAFVDRLANRAPAPVTPRALADVDRILAGMPASARPARRVREYEITAALDTHDTCQELLARHTFSGDERLLRVYTIPPLASDEERERIVQRARWEAQVLGRLGRIPGILSADPPFQDEAGIVLPLELFRGVSLASWADKFALTKKAEFGDRVNLWLRIAEALDQSHQQGVVHRLLRPEVILVDNTAAPAQLRVIGWDLAKQLAGDGTVFVTSLADERMRMAAPEVVQAFSSASPASDQFSLGAILALLVAGRPLFEATQDLLSSRRVVVRLRDVAPRAPLSLDEVVHRMLALRPAERFPSLAEAMKAVRDAIAERPTQTAMPAFTASPKLDPDNLAEGSRVGADYEILKPLGHGGMAVVYAARHLPSGRTRALKIARDAAAAEEALRGEYQALSRLDHPNIVRVLDLSNMIEGRLTLVMERVGGETLRQRLAKEPPLDPPTRRRYAEDLLSALDYLEQKDVTHKDLKPDNLLVGDGGLTVIDFSLAEIPAGALYGGTALYRDPSRTDWSHATDRYAAALCLFELYAGRHAFDGKVPEPGQAPSVRPEDIEPPGLAALFGKALHEVPEQRFPSARAMRDAFLLALGADVEVATPGPVPSYLDSGSPLRLAPLPPRAQNQLARAGVNTVGELLALGEAQIRGLSNLGDKTIRDILAFQAQVRARGLTATVGPVHREPALVPPLADSPEPLDRLALPARTRRLLDAARLATIGAVARLSRAQLLAVDGVGAGVLKQIVDALHRYRDHGGTSTASHDLDRLWEQATEPLTDEQRTAVDRFHGVTQEPEVQGDIAESLGVHQSTVSTHGTEGLKRLLTVVLADVVDAVEAHLDARHGLALLDEIGARLEEQWVPGQVTGRGIVRLLAKTHNTRFKPLTVDGVDGVILARPSFDRAAVRSFVSEVLRLARTWPPVESEPARRTLAAALPEFHGDHLQLATRLCEDVDFTEGGQLFHHPVQPKESLGFVLERERDAVALVDLKDRVRQVFGERCPFPEPDHLLEVLHQLGYQVQEGRVVSTLRPGSVLAPAPVPSDTLPPLPGAERPPELALRDLLREAAASRGFRMLITPPETHVELGRSVAEALGARYLSFEDAFFRRHGAQLAALERAEQHAAQRVILTEHAHDLARDLLEEHGRPGQAIVLGDTALLGLCNATDLARWLYDEALSGSQGFWVLVVPGVIHNRQPRFNEHQPLFHLDGVTFPLQVPMPAETRP